MISGSSTVCADIVRFTASRLYSIAEIERGRRMGQGRYFYPSILLSPNLKHGMGVLRFEKSIA